MKNSLLCIIASFILLFSQSLLFANTQGKAVVIVYDDSGSMGSGVGSRCNAVGYAIQVMTAFLTEDDVYYVIKMSDISNPIRIDLKSRQNAISQMKYWGCKGGTPIGSVTNAIDLLKRHDLKDKWLVIFTDGEFNTFTDNDKAYIRNFIRDDYVKLVLLNIDIPHGQFAKYLREIGGSDIFHSTSLSSDIIKNIEGITTTIMTLPEEGLIPSNITGNTAKLNSVFPLKRIIVLDQVATGSNNTVKEAISGGKALNISQSYTAEKDNMLSRITHIKTNENYGIIQAGEISIAFTDLIKRQNIKFLPQVALELEVNVKGFFKSKHANNIVVCHNDNEVEIIAKIIALDGTTVLPELLKKANVQLIIGQQSRKMTFNDSVFTYNYSVTSPVSLSISAQHEGYYHFRSNIYTLSVERCPVITLPQDIEYPPFKVTKSVTDGIEIMPIVDGTPLPLSKTTQIKLVLENNRYFEIYETKDAWIIKNKKVRCPCFAKTGKIPVKIELWSEASNRVLDTSTIYLNIENESFFKKCFRFILWILLLIIILWYIFGLIKKPRFSRQYNIFYRNDYGQNRFREYPIRFKSNLFKRYLIPYIPESIRAEGILFKASGKKNFVYISKNSLSDSMVGDYRIFLDGMERTESRFNKDLRLGVDIPLEFKDSNNNKYKYRYIKTSDNYN